MLGGEGEHARAVNCKHLTSSNSILLHLPYPHDREDVKWSWLSREGASRAEGAWLTFLRAITELSRSEASYIVHDARGGSHLHWRYMQSRACFRDR